MAEVIHSFGRNDAVGTAWEDVWTRGGVYDWPTSASQLRISSNSTDDTSTGGGGDGAQTVFLSGLDANFVPIEETVSLTNSTAVTAQSFLRMNRAFVVDCGTYATLTAGGNFGTITINTGSSGAVAEIPFADLVGTGQSHVARFTSPVGLFMYINSLTVSVNSAQSADFALFIRPSADATSAPFGARRVQFELDGVKGEEFLNPETPMGPYPPKTDLWWAVKAGANTAVSVDTEIILTPTTFQRS